MAGARARYAARILDRAAALDGATWDRLAGTDNPFLRHAFFTALEDSQAASTATGWQAAHILLEDADGHAAGLMPAYVKGHSYGEYVFDHAWAAAFERAGGRYYPKLQASVPFTPVTGPRLLAPTPAARRGLIAAACAACEQNGLSGFHVTFATAAEAQLMADAGLHIRTGEQFHWRNDGYQDFNDFLGALASRKRKAIRRERAGVAEAGIEIEVREGADVREADWDDFFAFYLDTGSRKWGTPYLNRRFFSLVGERMGETVVLMLARRHGKAVAGALNFRGASTLYGRYWGAIDAPPLLHFELCYYQAIDYAIAHQLATVEAGAQGPHKIARGYLPVATYSGHWLADAGFHDAVGRFLAVERREVSAEIDYLAQLTPFRKSDAK